MATIGLDNLYYATITEATATSTGVEIGDETYGTPAKLAKAISADLSIDINEATLYADDGAAENYKAFKEGTISLGVDNLDAGALQALIGAVKDTKGVVVSRSEDICLPVAIGFRALRSNGKYRYFWLYKVIFSIPATALATKGDNVAFNTPTIEGKIIRRNKKDEQGKHPWKSEITDGETGADATTISGWFSSVYEPDYT